MRLKKEFISGTLLVNVRSVIKVHVAILNFLSQKHIDRIGDYEKQKMAI